MRKGSLILGLASVLAFTGLVFAGTTGDLQSEILKKTNITNLEVRQDNNSIVLDGQAANLKDKLKAEKIAKDETESAVVNQIALAPTTKSDREIELEVVARLQNRDTRYTSFNAIYVRSFDGNVVLTGKIRDAYLSDYAYQAATEVSGVKSVSNKIDILPVSQNDDRLRVGIYNRMRRDSRLFHYFVGNQTSIVVIVENSRVTLAGQVTTPLDRTVAEHLVRGVTGVLSVDNQLQVRS
jgi:osmotically-inducible protein OsmY